MTVVFEFFGKEPIENLITCMHFKVDKVVYFGYHDIIAERKECTLRFLKKYCGVSNAVFHELSRSDLQSVLKSMRTQIEYELSRGSRIYFDVTGGESLILVAFGMLSREFDTPMHMFDIPNDKLIELEEGVSRSISKEETAAKVDMDLERYIEMKGGIINRGMHKALKEDGGAETAGDVAAIWRVAKRHIEYWNQFSNVLKSVFNQDDELLVSKKVQTVMLALGCASGDMTRYTRLINVVDDLASEGILLDAVHAEGRFQFKYKNRMVRDCLREGGSILELHVFLEQKEISDDCMAGVHIDWDGIIHTRPGEDVLNEVDVLSLKGNVPAFISCKSGRMGSQQVLHALYELNAVAKRFGGKYAKKVLVSAMELGDVYDQRAAEMGIEVRLA